MGHVEGWIGRKDRHPVEVDAEVHRTDGRKLKVRLTNFSDQGCRIENAEELRVGERVHIAVARMGSFKAQVRWAIGGSAGARFLAESDC
ncbi:MAG: PilZ domain-containing protein [Pseudomonadota bacterium]